MLKIKEAQEELAKKSYRDIQEETAWKWGSRAAASFENVLTADYENKITTYLLAEEYYHESIEHAALVDLDAPSLLKDIQNAVLPYASKAQEELERVFGV